ncbi:MAG TPA: lipocalin-like domain-containing protein [bacterium]|nr:lipocalin-like domain-containing protein [bacterium]
MEPTQLLGAWKLVRWTAEAEDAEATLPFGADAIGYLLYTEDGYMSVAMMKAVRRPYASGDLMDGTTEELAEAAATYHTYCGRYEVRGDTVVHHVEVALFPNRVGTEQTRTITLAGDSLTWMTPPFVRKGKRWRARVLWTRAGAERR